jgi:hypothetical protein
LRAWLSRRIRLIGMRVSDQGLRCERSSADERSVLWTYPTFVVAKFLLGRQITASWAIAPCSVRVQAVGARHNGCFFLPLKRSQLPSGSSFGGEPQDWVNFNCSCELTDTPRIVRRSTPDCPTMETDGIHEK